MNGIREAMNSKSHFDMTELMGELTSATKQPFDSKVDFADSVD